ncbi:MAG TPA: SDR family NAD(P)-dependent oxidoreductase [Acidimicrobiales bacterium]|nr:SDR family NAD(P)-dependent oxidoreductase [Acidimicrobiales bacterium]
MGLLNGKVAIVTGAAHGIGRGHALELAAQGASVVVNDLGGSVDGEGASRDADVTVELIRARGGTAIADYEDVADFDGAGRMVAHAVEAYGKLDILVNNAGIVRDAMVFNMTEAAWDAVIRVHLKGTYAPIHHAAKYWRERVKAGDAVAGRIINTTSGAGLSGNVGQANYTAAKAGIVGLTLTCSLELARLGVTVNCIAPGGATRIASTVPGFTAAKEPDEYEEFDPLDPSISSPIVAWLASDDASHVTGQVLRAIGETLILLEGWRYGPTVRNGGTRWRADTVGSVIATDIFKTRAPGLRAETGH